MFTVWVKKGPFWNVQGWSTSQEGAEKIAAHWRDDMDKKVRIKASVDSFRKAKERPNMRFRVELM